ncbi:MAG: YceI family protein [Pseudomonadota bacterium]
MAALSPPLTDTGSDRRYTTVAIILHWVIAVAILFQMVGGKWMVSAGEEASTAVFTVFQIHKTVGLSILALTFARIVWRLAHPAPALPEGMTRFEHLAASGTHVGFYALLILIPLSGWAMASVSPTGIPTFFFLLDALPFAHLPLLADASLAVRHSAEEVLKAVHENLSLVMGLLVLLHIAAALKHQFIAHDNLIARMVVSARTLPNSVARFGVGCVAFGLAIAFVAGGIVWGVAQKTVPTATSTETVAASTAPATAGAWVIDHAASTLGFTVTYTGNAVEGAIASWSGDIQFDPDDLGSANAAITIDMASITLGDATLQAQSAGNDGFDLANHATATYTATAFAALEDGRYQASGTLTLRGVSVDVPLTFTFAEADGVATVSGSAMLNRLDFGIGAVGAANEAWLLHAVEVTFDLTASRP